MRRVGILCAATLCLLSSESVMSDSAERLVDREKTFISGSVFSYAWLRGDQAAVGDLAGRRYSLDLYGDRIGNRNEIALSRKRRGDLLRASAEDFSSWGTSYDAMLTVGLRSRRDGFGSLYGADFSLAVPVGSGSGSLMYGRGAPGSRVFADTVWGNFSLGYQEGVESLMKVDVVSTMPGVSGGSWGRYLKRFMRYADGIPFHVYPGLYSENLFRSMGSLDGIGNGLTNSFKDIVSTVPLRASYVSKEIKGLSVGLSYSVAGYRDDLFKAGELSIAEALEKTKATTRLTSDKVRFVEMLSLREARFDSGPVYKNLVSAALRYNLEVSESAKLGFSLGAEYGTPRKYRDLTIRKDLVSGMFFVEYDSLSALSLGVEAEYGPALKAAVSYGYMGDSGRPMTYVGSDVRHKVPYLKKKGSYYLASSVGYRSGDLSLSLMCLTSRVGYNRPTGVLPDMARYHSADHGFKSMFDGENILTDFVLGLGYNVYKSGRTNMEMFLNCHIFSMTHRFNVHKYDQLKAIAFERFGGGESPFRYESSHKNTHAGTIALTGLKFTF